MSLLSEQDSTNQCQGFLRFLPTLLTIGNSLCGFTAILHCMLAYQKLFKHPVGSGDFILDEYVAQISLPIIFATCAWLIIGAMIFDALDGWTARKLNATSLHGQQMDSLADMVTFGVAPAVLVAVMAHTGIYIGEFGGIPYHLVWLCTAVYLGCAALRLATYNVKALQEDEHSDEFSGLPSPGAAAAIASFVILKTHTTFEMPYWFLQNLLPLYTAFLGLMMVSTIPFFHVGSFLLSGKFKTSKVALLSGIVILAIFDVKMTAFIIINLYICSGPLMELKRWLFSRKEQS